MFVEFNAAFECGVRLVAVWYTVWCSAVQSIHSVYTQLTLVDECQVSRVAASL